MDLFFDISLVIKVDTPKSERTENTPTNANTNEYFPNPTSPRYLAIIIIKKNESNMLIISPKKNMPVFFTIDFALDIRQKSKLLYKYLLFL